MSAKTRLMLVAVLATALVSCGGGEPSSEASSSPDSTSAGSGGDESAEEMAAPEDESSAEEIDTAVDEGGERAAVISIDGETTTFALDGIEYSPVEGVSDLTFETCNPDFFSSGRFYAIGYAVDGSGELLIAPDGNPAGMFTMDLPPDDWEATDRDPPDFDIDLGDLDVRMATPEEAAGADMSWSIDGDRARGTAVFVDFESSYTVDFEVVCEGSPTVSNDTPPQAADNEGDTGGGTDFVGAGSGSFTVDGEAFEGVEVFRCETFSFGGDPHPDDFDLLAYQGGMSGLEVDISNRQGVDFSNGNQFDEIQLSVFYSRQGENGVEQFEGSARTDSNGSWYVFDPETGDQTALDGEAAVIEGSRISGQLAGLDQTWPDEGAATVDVTFDLDIPTEINEGC